MSVNPTYYQSAVNDFNRARLRASLQEAMARLTGKSMQLLSYDEVASKLKLSTRSDRGIQNIPLNAIIGSVGRYSDFTRNFLPRRDSDRARWASVKAAAESPTSTGLPPIDVYKVGDAYFVLDGNHRVSIARQEGLDTIEAHVIEVKTEIQVTPDLQPDDLIIKAEYVDFLDVTELKKLRPNVDLNTTVPGQYHKLLNHIEVHRYFMGLDFQREVPYPEAVEHWYDTVYTPFADSIRERGLMRWFPERTETDLYLWVSDHRAALEQQLGWSISPEAAMENLAVEKSEGIRAKTESWSAAKIYNRYTDRLFDEILVPVDDSPDLWPSLEQAALIAQRESADLHGLHVRPSKDSPDHPQAEEARARFDDFCRQQGVPGKLAVVSGDISDRICEYALLTDLIVLNLSHPPGPGFSSLGSGLRSIIRDSARPILTVPGAMSPLDRALVAFDGSDKSREALFLATYLAERWGISLSILTVQNHAGITESVQEYARDYLELHEIQANFVFTAGTSETFLEVIQEHGINLVLVGSYSGTVVREVMIGSLVNFLLRQTDCPILICR